MDHVSPEHEHDAGHDDGVDHDDALNGRRLNRRRLKHRLLSALCLFLALLFGSLGVWQVERRAWKLDLIERVEARVHAAPVAAPPAGAWGALNPANVEYRRVSVTGTFLYDREALVEALTERGAGFWVLTPLRTADGVILVNRGFVPAERRSAASRGAQRTGAQDSVTGLLRLTEPGGRFLRPNQPEQDRWFSRDVGAIAARHGIPDPAPFFIDAEAVPGQALPIGGLTVVMFRNQHLFYALTWFALAGLSLAGLAMLLFPSLGRKGWTRPFSP